MPSKKSRRVRDSKTAINKPARTKARSKVVDARNAISDDAAAESTDAAVREAVKTLSAAAQKGVIHKNNASRRISRLMTAQNKAKAG